MASAPARSVGPRSVTITDDLGRTVPVNVAPRRIVSLAPSNTEILFALGLGDQVVGVTDFCNYPPEATLKARVGGFSTPDIEKIIALQPDLIVAAGIHRDEVIPKLERRGLTVVAVAPQTVEQILGGITKLGKAAGREREAASLVGKMRKRIQAVTDRTGKLSDQQRPRVMFVTWHDPLYTVGPDTYIGELIDKAGGKNLFPDISGHKTVGLEAVVARDPRVIIASTGHGEGRSKPLDWASSDSRLGLTQARLKSSVFGVDADLVNRAGPRIVDTLELFARFIHPEIFGR
ncbi:MAG: ABC transporter substrate-binding protein [Chloroflexota bacterium]